MAGLSALMAAQQMAGGAPQGGGTPLYDKLTDLYNQYRSKFDHKSLLTGAANYDYTPDKTIMLSKGKMNTARVPKALINDAIAAAKKAGVDPYKLLGLIGQESTFGWGTKEAEVRRSNKREYVSGRTLRDAYEPYDFHRFLADKKAPGLVSQKTRFGTQYVPKDVKVLEDFLATNPQYLQEYEARLSKTPELPDSFDDFYEAALRVKSGYKGYNDGDPNYGRDVEGVISLLRQDPALQKYIANPEQIVNSFDAKSVRTGKGRGRRPAEVVTRASLLEAAKQAANVATNVKGTPPILGWMGM